MKAKLQVKNVLDMVPALPLSCVFSQMGGIIGAAVDATWRIQDASGNIADTAARVVVIDGYFTIEALSGMPIFINGASAPITAARPVILADKDFLKIGDLECLISVGTETMSQTEVKSMSAFAMAANDTEDALLIDGEFSEASSEASIASPHVSDIDPLEMLDRGADRHKGIDPLAALDDSKIRLDSDEETLLKDDVANEMRDKYVNTIPDHSNSATASHLQRQVQRDRYGFEEEASNNAWESDMVGRAEIDLDHPVDHVALLPLTRALGLPLGNMSAADANRTLAEIGGALRAAVGGINKIYASRKGGNERFPLATMHLHAVEDNPLRFAKQTDEALHALFAKRGAVHMSAPSAMAEVVDHLDTHQSASEQAIDKALDSVLASLLPQALEKRFRSYAPDEKPAEGVERDAWCWGMYKAYFSELKSQRQQGLQMLFWEVFQHEYQGIMRAHDLDAGAEGINE